MKGLKIFLVAVLTVVIANGEMVYFKGVNAGTVTTGDLLDGADYSGLETNVAEVPGLGIAAWSGATNLVIKTLVDSMGVNRDQVKPKHIRLDQGESLTVAFDKDVEISRLDFNHFDDGESIMMSFEHMFDMALSWSNLSHKGSDYLDTNIIVSAGTRITYSVVGTNNSVIGLDGIDLTVFGEIIVPSLSLCQSNSMVHVYAELVGTASTNYVMQTSTNLIFDVWKTASPEFDSSTNMSFSTTSGVRFFRAIAQ